MPYSTERDPRNYKQWVRERYYSVRQGVQPFTVSRPIDVTLTVAGTAQNLYAISNLIPITNLVTNPSAETADPPTGWVAVGAATVLSRSAAQARNGTNSLLVNPDVAAAGNGA